MELRDQVVSFKISDVYLPDPRQMLFELHGNDWLEGKVADLSDDGLRKDAFAVIEVAGLQQPVIVPVDRLLSVEPAEMLLNS